MVSHTLAEEFGKLGCVFSFFPCVALVGFGYFGIAFAIGLAGHGQIHAYFGTFAVEMGIEVGNHFGIAAFCHTDFVFGYELKRFRFYEFFEFRFGGAAEGAFFGCFVTFVDITANGADKFFLHSFIRCLLVANSNCLLLLQI